MELPLAYYGNPSLRKKVEEVTEINDEIRQLVADMIETMHVNNGIGLAAPQVNKHFSVCITEVPIEVVDSRNRVHWEPGELRIFINPKIISHSEETWNKAEACLSIPGLAGAVKRPVRIVVQAMDIEGRLFEEEFEWMNARAIMHENDHLNGVLFIDRMHGKDRLSLEPKLQEIKRRFNR